MLNEPLGCIRTSDNKENCRSLFAKPGRDDCVHPFVDFVAINVFLANVLTAKGWGAHSTSEPD